MTLVRETVPNFLGGVSQAPDKLMQTNQQKDLVNCRLSPYKGLVKRPPTLNKGKILGVQTVHPLIHYVYKEDEQYYAILDGETIRVFDFDGEEQTVQIGYNSVDYGSANYILSDNPLEDLYAVTIGDYTFVLNKTKTTAMLDSAYPNDYEYSALIFVRQGDYSADYTITVNGEEVASYTTTDDNSTVKTTEIAGNLYNALIDSLGQTDWYIELNGSVILLTNNNSEDFTISCTDSNAGESLYTFKGTAETLSVLPVTAPNGFILEITGESTSSDDDYYVQFETSDDEDFSSGSWKECCCPGINYIIDPDTMPHALIRNSDGTFTFQYIEWGDRCAGDEDSIPNPSFIDNTIEEIFPHKGRIGFISANNTIYSNPSDIFSFFKQSALTELDTDPVDISSNTKMTDLKHSLPFNEEMIFLSETTGYSIESGSSFTNSSVSCNVLFEYSCSRYCKPINIGSTALFVFENGSYSRVREIYITSTYNTDAREVTEQVPNYLPNGIYKIIHSSTNNFACFLSVNERNAIYVYNWYIANEKKTQSAWSKWEFPEGKILGGFCYENLLYLHIQRTDGVYFETIDFTDDLCEDDLSFQFYLDRKTYFEDLEPEDGYTTFTAPYSLEDNFTVIDETGFPVTYMEDDGTITVTGEYEKLVCGETYTLTWQLPTFYKRSTNYYTNTTKIIEGILMLKNITLSINETGYFNIEITPKYETQSSSTFEFTGILTGTGSAVVGEIPITTGTFTIPVVSKNDEVTITITNDDYLPSGFLSLDWAGEFVVPYINSTYR